MSLESKLLFDQFCDKNLKPLSSYHFSAVFGWQDFFEFEYDVINERLCLFAYQSADCFLYLPPLGGEIENPTIDECFKRMQGSRIARIENISANQLNNFDLRKYNSYLKAHEYIYRREDLELLSGEKYKSKRHDINVFISRYPKAVFRPYVPADYQGCVDLYRRWSDNRRQLGADDVYLGMLDENAHVHALLIKHAKELWLFGRVVEIDGRIVAYTFGYILNPETWCVLLEITDLKYAGLSAYIFNCFCKDETVKKFEFINTMDDCGLPNVAKAKESYHPIKKLPIYSITKRDLL